jgi:hypothetical protein
VKRFLLSMLLVPLMALGACATTTSTETASAPQSARAFEGLWRYTGLVSSSGNSMPLTGVFLFDDGEFLQQAVFDGADIARQGAMAHSGPYTPTAEGVNLVAEQTISISPDKTPALSFTPNTKHILKVDRAGDRLTLTFGSGTVQTFQRIGAGEGDVYRFSNGRLALADGHFILVTGDEASTVTGFGRYTRRGDQLDLDVMRWAEASGGQAKVQRDLRTTARFDGRMLTLADGRQFAVLQ